MKPTILLTGAGGFIGLHLAQSLIKEKYPLILVGRDQAHLDSSLRQIPFIRYAGTVESLQEGLGGKSPKIIVHLASLFLAQNTPQQISSLIESNILFGTHLVQAGVERGVTSFLNTGTAWQNYQDQPSNPVNLYAATKEAFEQILKYYQSAYGLFTLTLRLNDTYGLRDMRSKIISLLIRSGLSGSPLKLSPGLQILQPLHILDVCRGYLRALNLIEFVKVSNGSVFALRGNEKLTLRELANLVGHLLGCPVPAEFGETSYREREVFKPESRLPLLPGWKAEISLEDGLIELINDFPD